MEAPVVSAICAFHNGEAFIEEAIASVLGQDCADFELLLVDDGSTDGGTKIARDYAERFPDRIRYLEQVGHENRGASSARNLGLRHARGEFVTFIDCDDRWRPEKLSQQLQIMRAHPDAGMLCGSVNYWSSWCGGIDRVVATGRKRDGRSDPPQTLLDLYPLGEADAPCPSDVMLRRSVVEAVGGFEEGFAGSVQMYEDQAFLTKIYLAAPVLFSSHVWIDYRQHQESCVAVVHREGLYRGMRAEFLDWLAAYVSRHGSSQQARILRAIAFARWQLDHPGAGRYVRRARRLYKRLVR